MSALPVLPVVIPLGCAVTSLLLRTRPAAQRILGVAGTAALLAASVALLLRVSDGTVVVLK